MKSFLEYVAEDILEKYGTNLSQVVVVFPNKRASLFLNEQLARLAGQPVWSPSYITISDLFRRQSSLQVADPIESVCLLHRSFCAVTGSQEPLDKFYGWGQLLLADFDDIDKNMADADRVLANLRDLHELDDLSYLTDEQLIMLKRFFNNFNDDHPTQLKERFLHLWSRMADIYHDFRQRLEGQGLAYEGMLYRSVVEQCAATGVSATAFPNAHYLFVGFNLLQQVEQRLFAMLQREGKARFYWDFDRYYLAVPSAVGTPHAHEAGQFISRYLSAFPNELDTTRADIYDCLGRAKSIRYVSAPTENIQARYVSEWLQAEGRMEAGRRTAIVMCNESLLPTVIHSLPSGVKKVNVTTGYPLAQTAVASFIQLWFDLLVQGSTPRLMRTLRRHPFARHLGTTDDVAPPQAAATSAPAPLAALLAVLRRVASAAAPTAAADPLLQESLFRGYMLVNRLNDLQQQGVLTVAIPTVQHLVSQLVQQTTIPFHGEPAEGLQVMGVLETRNLDFDHVLLLSCGEGMMPRGVNDSSFIPHSIRQAYELTTVENKVSIYSYYFHRLLQRATDVTILYNSSTEGGQRGEMSRFMLQLMVEWPHAIRHYSLACGQQSVRWQPQPIAKPDASQLLTLNSQLSTVNSQLSTLNSQLSTVISPTAINTWLRCGLMYFYRYVAGLRGPEIPDDELELDNRIFGNVFHRAAELLYRTLPQYVDKAVLQALLRGQQLERAVGEAFHQEMPYLPQSGLYIIQREVIVQYLRQLVALDIRQAPFRILGLETDAIRELTLPATAGVGGRITVGGRIDRLDFVDEGTARERIRVVDYKTGSRQLKAMADVDAIFQPQNIHDHSDYYLQTLLYADNVRSLQLGTRYGLAADTAVSPALLFIQHAAADDYDPTLCFGRTPILDIAPHSQRFRELLTQTVSDILSPDVDYRPTTDQQVCATCPYHVICQR